MNKYFNKQTVLSFILGGILFSSVGVFAATQLNVIPNSFPIKVNNNVVDLEAYNIEGRTYLQLRDTTEVLNAELDFKDNTIYINTEENTATIQNDVNENIDININNESEDYKVESIINKTVDDLKIYTYDTELKKYNSNGTKYIKLVHLLNAYKDYGYDIEVKDNTGNLTKNKTLLLSNIPLADIDYFTMIEYDYYINNILPLLSKEDM